MLLVCIAVVAACRRLRQPAAHHAHHLPSQRHCCCCWISCFLCVLQHFLAAAACGSQLHIIPDAHHLQFCSSSPYLNALLDTADNLFTDAGMSHMGASLLLALYLHLAGCKASGRPLPASAMLGCNSSDERVALFDELYHHMLVSC